MFPSWRGGESYGWGLHRWGLHRWPAARLEVFRRLLRGELDAPPLQELFQGPIIGLLFVLKQIAEQLGLTPAIGHNALGKLALFLVLARLPHQGSRLWAVRWAEDHAVNEVLGLTSTKTIFTPHSTTCVHSRKDRAGSVPPLPEPPGCTTAEFVSLRRHQQLSGRREERTRGVRLRPRWQARQAANRHRPADRRPRGALGGAGVPRQHFRSDDGSRSSQDHQEQFQVEELVFVGDRGMVKSRPFGGIYQSGLAARSMRLGHAR